MKNLIVTIFAFLSFSMTQSYGQNWKFDYDISINKLSLKDRVKRFLRKYTGIELGYKNYIKV